MPDLTLDAPRADADADALPDLIEALWTPKLDPLFWRPARVGIDSAWTAHVPFAHWLVATARPHLVVELGTHNGVSYSAFCEAVLREKLEARCYAVDTWQGDAHAGFYGEEVLRHAAPLPRRALRRLLGAAALHLRRGAAVFRRRLARPAAHRRLPRLRAGARRFRELGAEALGPRGGAVPRHQRARARLRRLAAVGGTGGAVSGFRVPARPRTGRARLRGRRNARRSRHWRRCRAHARTRCANAVRCSANAGWRSCGSARSSRRSGAGRRWWTRPRRSAPGSSRRCARPR